MPTLNAERFIGQALSSIAVQKLTNVEVVISDGGSTDATLRVAQTFSSELTIRIVPGVDDGQTDGLNRALEHARGSIFGWMNANDEYCPQSLSALVERMERNSRILLAYGHHEQIDESGANLSWHPALPPWAWVHRHEGFVMNAQSMLWHRGLQDRIGHFDNELRLTMDYDLILRLLDATGAREAVRVDVTVGRFRRHEGQKTSEGSSALVLEEHLQIQINSGRSSARHRTVLLPLWFAGRLVRLWTIVRYQGIRRTTEKLLDGPRLLPRRGL
jgi:glycosyltransferase involved in cell wall biosynthesis